MKLILVNFICDYYHLLVLFFIFQVLKHLMIYQELLDSNLQCPKGFLAFMNDLNEYLVDILIFLLTPHSQLELIITYICNAS